MIRLVLGLSLLLAGCSLNPPFTIDPTLSQRIPPSAEIIDTPFIEQADFQCGPAALAMVLNYYQAGVQPQQLAAQVFTPKARGSFPVEMDIASRRQGFISYPVDSLDQLLEELAAGHPVLVLQNLGIDWLPQWHFAVAVGYNLQTRELVLRSGDLKRRITPLTVFDNTWQRSERWGRVVLPPDRVPGTADPVRYTRLIHGLEQIGHQALAQQAYTSATRAWPQSPAPRFALANLLLTTEQADAASAHYQQLLSQHPRLTQGWNNYAYALRAQGCLEQAERAARCGLQLAPQDTNLRDTVAEMRRRPSGQSPRPCPPIQCPAPARSELQ